MYCCDRRLKTFQEARSGVEKRLKMLMYASVHCAFSALFALSRAPLKRFQPSVGGPKTFQEARSGVEECLKMRMVASVHGAFSVLFALSRAPLKRFRPSVGGPEAPREVRSFGKRCIMRRVVPVDGAFRSASSVPAMLSIVRLS